jgi:hypothetical protein
MFFFFAPIGLITAKGEVLKDLQIQLKSMIKQIKSTLPMIYECKMHFGSSYNEAYFKGYRLPGQTDVYGMFDEKSGDLTCFSYMQLFFPKLQECSSDRSKIIRRGLIYVKNEEVSYDNCFAVISNMMLKVTNTQTEYSVDIQREENSEVDVFELCFKAEVRYIKMGEGCPRKYKKYRIDVRNFTFRSASGTTVKGKKFFKSPSVKQYEYLLANNYPLAMDDYDYKSHENDYDVVLDKKNVLNLT